MSILQHVSRLHIGIQTVKKGAKMGHMVKLRTMGQQKQVAQ